MTKTLTLEIQNDEVGEAVRARYTMTASIIRAMLYSSNREMVKALGGPEKITLEQLARIYQEGTGDFGICFEYALHDSIRARHKSIYPIIEDVLHSFCKIKNGAESILFGLEKNGTLNIVETAKNSLTTDARVLVGKQGQPPLLKHRIGILDRAFRMRQTPRPLAAKHSRPLASRPIPRVARDRSVGRDDLEGQSR